MAVEKVAGFMKGRILVGHAVWNDLRVLKLVHPRSKIRDTSVHRPFAEKLAAVGGGAGAGSGNTGNAGRLKPPWGLKRLVKDLLGVQIQSGAHSSVEDAQATMLLYRKYRSEFE